MKKNLKYYLDINYPVEIQKIKEEEGGGYMASIPLLGKYAFLGDGETVEEAIDSLNEIKEYLFEKYLEENVPIPEPKPEEEKEYSGKFLLRIPKELHRFLTIEAQRNQTTLNQYCTYLLNRKSLLKGIHEELDEVRSGIKNITTWIQGNNYKMKLNENEIFQSHNVTNINDYEKAA